MFVCMPWRTRPVFIVQFSEWRQLFSFSFSFSAYSENTQSVSHMAAHHHMNTHTNTWREKRKKGKKIVWPEQWESFIVGRELTCEILCILLFGQIAMLGKAEKRAPWETKQV